MPLIANLIGYSQYEDSVTKSEGKKTGTGYISDSIAYVKVKDSFCNKMDEVLIRIYAMQNV